MLFSVTLPYYGYRWALAGGLGDTIKHPSQCHQGEGGLDSCAFTFRGYPRGVSRTGLREGGGGVQKLQM